MSALARIADSEGDGIADNSASAVSAISGLMCWNTIGETRLTKRS